VIGYVSSLRPCAGEAARLAPDVVIVDQSHDLDHSLARVSEVRGALPRARIILLAWNMEPDSLARAAAAGLDAAIRRTGDSIRVGGLMKGILAGDIYHAFAPLSAERPESAATYGLTSREIQILRLVAAGASNAAIAKELWITEQTVKFHLSNVYRKLGVATRTQASRYAHLHGMLDIDDSTAPPSVAA